jgi:hypothetical protein
MRDLNAVDEGLRTTTALSALLAGDQDLVGNPVADKVFEHITGKPGYGYLAEKGWAGIVIALHEAKRAEEAER